MTHTSFRDAEQLQNTDVDTDRRRRPATNRSGWRWRSTLAKIGWVVLLVISIGGVLNHLLGAVTFATRGEEQLLFAMFAGINAYATAVLLSSYRQRKVWAWLVTWLQVAAFAAVLPLTGGGGIGLGYLVVAVIAGLAQLATLPTFWCPPGPQR